MAARPSTYDGDRAAGNTLLSYPLYVMRLASWVLARASLYVLLALRLDGTITCLYTIVLLPLWLLVCMEFFLSCASARADSQSERAPVLKQLALGRSVVALFCALILVRAAAPGPRRAHGRPAPPPPPLRFPPPLTYHG
eukprot:5870544-Prymnesium_polylepis.1